jgi:hypothetical protein
MSYRELGQGGDRLRLSLHQMAGPISNLDSSDPRRARASTGMSSGLLADERGAIELAEDAIGQTGLKAVLVEVKSSPRLGKSGKASSFAFR